MWLSHLFNIFDMDIQCNPDNSNRWGNGKKIELTGNLNYQGKHIK